MKARRQIAPSILLAGLLTALPAAAEGSLEMLVQWLTGWFSSHAQAAGDEGYLDIRLHVVPIWTDRSDAVWLYVEQAVAGHEEQPYRQRVYRVRQIEPGLFESAVFTVEAPERLVGEWRAQDPLRDLGPADLVEREGCAVLLRWTGEAFSGGSLGRLCTSTQRGASFATSEVTVTADRLLSWDRGFDAAGTQVWGAVTGGYVFDRIGGPDAAAANP